MLVSYTFSIYSINFFMQSALTKIKLRLINQQTADCNQSGVLDANDLSPKVFPIIIKMKGSDRLLLKIKLFSVLPKNMELLVGEGVVNIDSKVFENSLRVPIYDKKQGVEEVAICSIDIYVSGFSVQKNSFSINKSLSRINDQRDASEDVAFSQMSYTLQSQNEHSQKQQPQNIRKQSIIKDSPRTVTFSEKSIINPHSTQKNDKQKNMQQANHGNSRINNVLKNKYLDDMVRTQRKINQQKQSQQQQYGENLQNSIYSIGKNDKIHMKNDKIVTPKQKQTINQQLQSQKIKQNQVLNSSGMYNSPMNKELKDLKPKKIKSQMQQNEKILTTLKNFLIKQDNNQSQYQSLTSNQKNRIKYRRKKLKIQALESYKYQNTFIKYLKNVENRPIVLLKNLKALRIIQNQVKQSQEQVIQLPINKVVLSTMKNDKIVSYDCLGYRYYCTSNGIKQNSLGIHIPFDQISLKVSVELKDEGNFQGILGLQEGQDMAIRLYRLNQQNKAHRTQEIFKLYFDIKPINAPSKNQLKSNRLDKTLANNDESFLDKLNIKQRIQTLSIQPWGYIQNSNKKDEKMNKLRQYQSNQQKSRRKTQHYRLRTSSLSILKQPQSKHTKIDNSLMVSSPEAKLSKHLKFVTSQDNQDESADEAQGPKSKQKKNVMKIKKQRIRVDDKDDSLIKQINNIRNGNRNNYKFKKRSQQNIKQLWQELLIKKKVQEQQKLKKELLLYRRKLDSSLAKRKSSNRSSSLYSQLRHNSPNPSMPINQPKLFKILSPSKPVYPQQLDHNQDLIHQTQYPVANLTLQINNISITQSKLLIDEDVQSQTGKFIKISIQDKIDYYTEVIFNGEYNSILWKLQGCVFNSLSGHEKLQIEIYSTLNNQIKLLGKAVLRLKKLIFLRNNHIYNGRILYDDIINGEFTLSFNVFENIPFQIVEEDSDYEQTGSNRVVSLEYDHSEQVKRKYLNNKVIYGKGQEMPIRLRKNNEMLNKNMSNRNDLLNTMRKNTNRSIRSKMYIQPSQNNKGNNHSSKIGKHKSKSIVNDLKAEQ